MLDYNQSRHIEAYQESKLKSIRDGEPSSDFEEVDDDELLQQLEDESDDILAKYRESRIQQLSGELKNIKQSIQNRGNDDEEDLGYVENITNEKKIMEIVLQHPITIVHFYQPNFQKCQLMNKYLNVLAEKHLQLKIIRIKAELAPFLVNKLQIKILPFIIIYKNSIEVDRIVGFEKFNNAVNPSYESFENYLLVRNIINRKSIKFGLSNGNRLNKSINENDDDDDDDDLDI
ncbi:thioredoxin-like protein [Scheffersomyces amazonensis]|uniref:thioredoxin-like protein n=1 Tax=Scheffersomyces amazonensis TaxID=1078765 RepID=UPI00315CD220